MTIKAAVLTLAWALLTGDFHPGNVGFGLLAAVAALAVARPLGTPGFARVRPARLPGFVAYFAWQVLLSNLRMVRAVLSPLRRLRAAIVAVPLVLDREDEIALLANLITLTPGTVTVEADAAEFLVHALTREAAAGLADSEMDRRVTRLEGTG